MIDLRLGDCLEVLKTIPDNSIDLIVTSPPYNKGYWSSNRNVNNYSFYKTKNSRVYFDRKKAMFNKNIWDINPDKNNDFPAPFPVELPMNCILSTTKEGDMVLDPFMGSGTTGVACKLLNRDFIGIELNKDFFDMARQRIDDTEYKFEDLD